MLFLNHLIIRNALTLTAEEYVTELVGIVGQRIAIAVYVHLQHVLYTYTYVVDHGEGDTGTSMF